MIKKKVKNEFVCKLCGNTFTRNTSLNRHLDGYCKTNKQNEQVDKKNQSNICSNSENSDLSNLKLNYDVANFEPIIKLMLNKYLELND